MVEAYRGPGHRLCSAHADGASRRENAVSRRVHPVPRPHRLLQLTAALGTAVAGAFLAVPLATAAGGSTTTPVVTEVLTNSSNGKTVYVAKGWHVEVKLSSDGFRWTEASPINAGPEVVLQRLSGHVDANGSSTTTFLVVSYSGEVTLESTGVKKCSNNPACTPIVMTWRANVISYVA
jgi:hypothetical protein